MRSVKRDFSLECESPKEIKERAVVNGHDLSILFIDDEPGILEIGKILLEQSGGLSVSLAENAYTGLNLLSNRDVDVIVSDYEMPGMDGIALLRHIRSEGWDTPFIIFTGHDRHQLFTEAMRSGADAFILKGGNPKTQFAILAKTIRDSASSRISGKEKGQKRPD
ncbi:MULTISPECIES: response regulator [Methanocalculus]|uniref:response regulator n=1 Tax=Methanocalculus TaxID=71151 RepID=UPI00209F0BAC|nr:MULTISPECIES: response regulator transcription factor [unclassified Methanocalculus]MCP1661405.1 DNA-binding NtrC family response regulator [Methanocalculus sp. AMF5]